MIPSRTFYFLRHGQTDSNRDGRYQGTSDTPLNDTGVTQAKAAASAMAAIRINRIVASPLMRALKTAEIVADKIGVPIYVDRDLRERHFGSFEGLVIREVKQKHGLPFYQSSRSIMPPDADHWDEIFERVPQAIGRWLTTHESETLLFVAHGGVFDAIHAHLIGPRGGPESKHASPYKIAPTATGWLFTLLAA